MKHNSHKPIPDQLSPGSRRTTQGIRVPGHLVTSGLQDSGLLARQPGPAATGLLKKSSILFTNIQRLKLWLTITNQVQWKEGIWKEEWQRSTQKLKALPDSGDKQGGAYSRQSHIAIETFSFVNQVLSSAFSSDRTKSFNWKKEKLKHRITKHLLQQNKIQNKVAYLEACYKKKPATTIM